MIALINPNFIWIIMNGLFIKNLVAPTNCIVLIVILWEYTDSLIVLFIKIIDKNNNKEEFFQYIPEFLPEEIKEEIEEI